MAFILNLAWIVFLNNFEATRIARILFDSVLLVILLYH